MPWVRLDDGYPEHPKVDRVGPMAAWLNVCAWAYCARNLTDGFVPEERVARLAAVPKPRQLAERLVEEKLWERAEGGFTVHDYLVYNPSRDQVLKERADTAQRVAEYRARRNGVTPPGGNGGSNSQGNTVTNGVGTDAPYPSRLHPDPEETRVAPNGASVEVEETSPGDDRVDEVYAHFKARIQPRSRLCPRKKIASRLKRFSPAELKEGVDHFADDPWWMENNASRGAEWFFESDGRSEQFLLMKPRATTNVVPRPVSGTTGEMTREQAQAMFGYLTENTGA